MVRRRLHQLWQPEVEDRVEDEEDLAEVGEEAEERVPNLIRISGLTWSII